jgi:hypothetical protein
MADYPSNIRWLTPEEQLLAAQRLAYDGLGNAQSAYGKIPEKEAFKVVVRDWRIGFWLCCMLLSPEHKPSSISFLSW